MQRTIVTGILVFVLTMVGIVTEPLPDEAGAATGCVLSGHVDGYTVPAGVTCNIDGLLTSSGNIIVKGTLKMRAGDTLKFVDVDNSKFVGGGDVPIDSDVGLWVIDAGVLDAKGSWKQAWSYEWEPSWKASDKIVAAPNTKNAYKSFKEVDGPGDVPKPNIFGYKAELLNLTRNVKIQGTKNGFAHIFIKSSKQSTIKYVELRFLGVQVDGNDASGRYGLHLHHNGTATDGMEILGVVARNIGNHAFVPHASHGITFKKTIAYNTVEEAYWWDPKPADLPSDAIDPNATNDLTITCAIAAKVDTDGEGRGTAFYMGSSGENVKMTNSVAVGVYSSHGKSFDISGYKWPGTGRTNWTFNNNIAHNNKGHGIFVWQNTADRHVITNFDAYFNGKFGISHGAYRNPYKYKNLELWGNFDGAIESHANAKLSPEGLTQRWEHVRGNGKWKVVGHGQPPLSAVNVIDVILPKFVVKEGNGDPSWFVFTDSHFDTVDLSGANKLSIFKGL